ncbi:MAG: Ku protein [Actinobacteria bacterium]|nr:Ku protein [Micrococcales bacterium]MCB9427420.1 Ku protein [Actinomycetota bacterium]HPQ84810.1 Ku protein [Actinomycetota bacterium]
MRAIWKGSISFGLVSVPVKAYTATEDHDVRFHQVHAVDNGRVKYNRVCRECGNVLELSDIAKAYQVPNGPVIVLDEEDFASLPVTSSKEIDVVEFVPSAQVDPVRFDKSYLLEPDERSLKPYVLLRETLEDTDLTAIVKVSLRQKQQLGVLRVRENVLMLQTMLWPDEVREPHFDILDQDVDIRAQELTMAASLVESLAGDFDPDQYHDNYREQLLALIDTKVHGGEGVVVADQPTSEGGEVVDLLTALRESLARAGGDQSAAPKPRKSSAKKTPAKKTATQKTPAKKTAAKAPAKKAAAKTPAKKTTAKKTPAKKTAKKAPAKKTTAAKRTRKTA